MTLVFVTKIDSEKVARLMNLAKMTGWTISYYIK